MENNYELLDEFAQAIVNSGNTNDRKILDLSARYLSLEMELEAEEDEITCDYLSDMMAEIDVVIEKLKAVC